MAPAKRMKARGEILQSGWTLSCCRQALLHGLEAGRQSLPEVVSHMASAGLEHGEAEHWVAGLKMLIHKLAFRCIA